ncbi:MAG TPA: hypothetical protein VK619_17190 [Pyrinomonadaceae bacterium]|nr:hypothetical protein [Pyrinomonadaceae bacterium]
MIIRKEQMAVFETAAEEEFVKRMAQYLKEQHAGAVAHLSDERLRRRVRGALARGRSHGLTWESALAGFVVLMFEVAPNFDLHPAFHEVLQTSYPNENERIRAIYENVRDEEWEEAQEFYDQSAWFLIEGEV